MDIEERAGHASGERSERITEEMIEVDQNGLREGFEKIFSDSLGRPERVREVIDRYRSNHRDLFQLVEKVFTCCESFR
mgnify:CR=1 FL=1